MNWNVKLTKWFWLLIIVALILLGLLWARNGGLINI